MFKPLYILLQCCTYNILNLKHTLPYNLEINSQIDLFFNRHALPTTKISRLVLIKQLNASSGVHTIGSPLTLSNVLTNTGQSVKVKTP